ncbi:hypothetical protein KC19_7G148800 [Ceratodon purpureus]|uniref:DNA (cytosine-5-)-methyltransferase n=1 Tax=Ceratodon purpureus TaxID=3225 RepID=A0A8T0HBT2_CERPU|nr:hypothetical protein KC19_7G148800 [Ceratodon purpureus]
MSFGASVKEETTMEELASIKVKQVREVLGELLLLPPEVIDQALQKISEFEGDIERIADYAISLPNPLVPQVECIEEHLSDDMVSSDEELERNGAAEEEQWEDPICKLFKKSPVPENHTVTRHEGESSRAAGDSVQEEMKAVKAEPGSVPRAKVNQKVDAGASCSYQLNRPIKKELEPSATPPTTPTLPDEPLPDVPSAPLVRPSPPLSPSARQARFRDMGFSTELVDHAFKQRGADADDSALLQFILDYKEVPQHVIDNLGVPQHVDDNLGAPQHGDDNLGVPQHVDEDNSVMAHQENEEQSEEESEEDNGEEGDDIAEMRARILPNLASGPSLKAPARMLTDEVSSDSDAEIPARTPCNVDWGEGPSNSVDLANEGLRVSMYNLGFLPELVERAIQELGEGVEPDMLTEYLLYMSTQEQEAPTLLMDGDISTLQKLTTEFQFPTAAVEKAMSRCNTPLLNATQDDMVEVVDFLAAHMDNLIEEDAITLPDSDDSDEDDSVHGGEESDVEEGFLYWNSPTEGKGKGASNMGGKRKPESPLMGKGKLPAQRGRPKGSLNTVKKSPAKFMKLPMIRNRGATGFGLPGMPLQSRHLKEDVKGAPFFYFENVASMPQGAWSRIQAHLFDIAPEFVDAMYFSTCRRSRGYIHNLPIEGRKKMIKDPPMTIKELLPQTKPFWPEWDNRTKLNCINTVRGSEYCAKQQGVADGSAILEPNLSDEQKKDLVRLCSKWNLVWTSPNLATPVEANEIEAMLGFDRDHSRPCLGNQAKYKALGNSFSVYVVAYHFSVLKPLYPNGIKVLSLFTGIGGAEVALHKVGIKLTAVVSVEIEKEPRRIFQAWWGSSKQTGILDIDYHDVRHLTREVLLDLVCKYQGFDLIVGGSPCNNLTGNNRCSRTGLDGKHSNMFFEFSRIVSTVRELTLKLQRGR